MKTSSAVSCSPSKVRGSLAMLVVVLTTASPSAAILIEANDRVFGRGSITRDLDSGLEWLDLTETAGRSFFDVLAETERGGEFAGFRIATAAEVEQLFLNAGIPDIDTVEGIGTPGGGTGPLFTAANFEPTLDLINLLGPTAVMREPGGLVFDAGGAFTSTPSDVLPGGLKIAFLRAVTASELGLAEFEPRDPNAPASSYLVRTTPPIPEPSAALLFGVGALGVAAYVRRRVQGEVAATQGSVTGGPEAEANPSRFSG